MMKKLFTDIFLLTLLLVFISSTASALCVNVPEANLRSGPNTKQAKTWEVFKYMPFSKISQKGNWYEVKDVDGDIHWIYNKLVTDKYKCAVVKSEKANVRSGPGKKYKKNLLSPAQKYTSFRIVETKGSWVKVKDEFGDTGWIHKNLLWIQ